ncbi:hypothetical protein BASA60_004490 [Batrachochytrium salamandrivorans]|nr:hypothetical protein BASA60_004490 [Batrachochytrium salamandrivorans]
MKLAIASTTLLFAMMAAQAAVLSATSSTDVNLVKRAPTSDDETEQNDMTGQSSSGSTSQDSTDDQSSSGPTSQGPLTDKEQEKMQESFVILSGKTNKLRESIQSQREEISALKTLVKQLKGMREGENLICMRQYQC